MSKNFAGTEIVMPALEMAQEHGVLVRWLKAEGEFVNKGEPLMEIQTDKALTEIESPEAGFLSHVSAHPGDEVPVGRVIATLFPARSAEEQPSRDGTARGQRNTEPSMMKDQLFQPTVPESVSRMEASSPPRQILASPKARRMAAQAGVDLNAIEGSGPGKAVLPEDILKLAAQTSTPPAAEFTAIAVKGIRRTIAEKLQNSAQQAPHIALSLSVDMSVAKASLQDWNASEQRRERPTVSMTCLICKAVASSLLQHPRLNSHFLGDEIREFSPVHLGIAVALEEGIVVPVVRNAHRKNLPSFQSELADLTNRGRLGKLQASEMKGSTFTLSNLGMFRVDQFTAILNPPEVGILSIGTILDTPIGWNGQVVLRPVMQVTVNVDHRAVDGAVAARFISTIKDTLENPRSLFTE